MATSTKKTAAGTAEQAPDTAMQAVQAPEKAAEKTYTVMLPLDPSRSNQTVPFWINGRRYTVKRGESVTVPEELYRFIQDEWLPQVNATLRTRMAMAQTDE